MPMNLFHGNNIEIDEYGCSLYHDFPQINELLREIVRKQMKKRIANRKDNE